MAFDPATIATDDSLERDGTTVEMPDGGTITVRRAGCIKHQKAQEAARKPFKAYFDSGRQHMLSEGQIALIEGDTLANGIVVRWDGWTIPYDPDTARKLLRANGALRRLIIAICTEDEAFRAEAKKEAEGNSAPPLAGQQSSAAN